MEYLRTNEKNPSSVGYPSGRFAKLYSLAGQEVYGKAALFNPSLYNALKSGTRQPRVLCEHPDVARMKRVVARLQEALNYSYWCLGALHLLASCNLLSHLLDLEEQLFKAVCPLTTHFMVPKVYAPGSVSGQVLQLEIQQLRTRAPQKRHSYPRLL